MSVVNITLDLDGCHMVDSRQPGSSSRMGLQILLRGMVSVSAMSRDSHNTLDCETTDSCLARSIDVGLYDDQAAHHAPRSPKTIESCVLPMVT